ncbi:MAG: hypothetical protein OEY19_13300 [Gammaproteobacteria bacterium]|nr:hypothetical protein [Gammaproteobacteria bacterium]MDH5629200.1 hypothetical protein [Gammaproteobacteria bacterium]
MPFSRKEIKEIERKPFKKPPFTNFFVHMLRLISKISPIKRYLRETIGGLYGRIFRLWETEEYEEATKVAIFSLEKYRHKNTSENHFHWWQFMKHGVDSATKTDNQKLKDKLIEYAISGIEPFKGYDVAYSYLEFSKWQHQIKEHNKAIEYAKIASEADNTWADPDFILGWYSLILGESDAEAHLSRAIEKDPKIFFRITNNKICQKHPNIINKLKTKYSDVTDDN